jgi:hypothetical protein
MAIQRSSLIRGPAKITFGGATFFTRDDIVLRHVPVWEPVVSSLHGQIDKFKRDFMIRFSVNLMGLWDNLGVLFPSALVNPVVGARIFGDTDTALVIHAKNQDRVTLHNCQITGLASLHLGVDQELFSGAVEFTALLKNNANPEDSGAYFTADTAAYTETTFALTAFKKARWTGAWGAKTGFTAIVPQGGFQVGWQLDLVPDVADGHGTIDMTIGNGALVAQCRCVPLGPTPAQTDTAQDVEAAHGTLLSAGSADLTLTAGSDSLVLTNANLVESGRAFGTQPLRIGEVVWETTRLLTAGATEAVAVFTEAT